MTYYQTVIINAVGNELVSNSTPQQIADAIMSDKEVLVDFLNLYGLTGQVPTTTLSTLLSQLGGINATRYYQLADNLNISDFTTWLVNSLSMSESIEPFLATPIDGAKSENLTVTSIFDNLGSLTDTSSSLLQTILTLLMNSNSVSYTPPMLSDIMAPMTSDTSSDGTALASSNYNASPLYQSYKAFDGNLAGNTDGSGGWVTFINNVTGWLQFHFNTTQIVKQYNVVGWRYDAGLTREVFILY